MKLSIRPNLASALAALLATVAFVVVVSETAKGQPQASVIRFTVPVSAVRAHETDIAPKGESPGDGFQETYTPAHSADIVRQEAVAIGTFRGGVFLGTITLKEGQIVYAGSTGDQDNATWAILGGTGTYQGAQGTVTTHAISRSQVRITIAIEPPTP